MDTTTLAAALELSAKRSGEQISELLTVGTWTVAYVSQTDRNMKGDCA